MTHEKHKQKQTKSLWLWELTQWARPPFPPGLPFASVKTDGSEPKGTWQTGATSQHIFPAFLPAQGSLCSQSNDGRCEGQVQHWTLWSQCWVIGTRMSTPEVCKDFMLVLPQPLPQTPLSACSQWVSRAALGALSLPIWPHMSKEPHPLVNMIRHACISGYHFTLSTASEGDDCPCLSLASSLLVPRLSNYTSIGSTFSPNLKPRHISNVFKWIFLSLVFLLWFLLNSRTRGKPVTKTNS